MNVLVVVVAAAAPRRRLVAAGDRPKGDTTRPTMPCCSSSLVRVVAFLRHGDGGGQARGVTSWCVTVAVFVKILETTFDMSMLSSFVCVCVCLSLSWSIREVLSGVLLCCYVLLWSLSRSWVLVNPDNSRDDDGNDDDNNVE